VTGFGNGGEARAVEVEELEPETGRRQELTSGVIRNVHGLNAVVETNEVVGYGLGRDRA